MTDGVGINVFLTEGMIEFALTGVVTAGIGVAGWVWTLGTRLARAEAALESSREEFEMRMTSIKREMDSMESEISLNRRTTLEIGKQLDAKIERSAQRLEEVKDELPSRGFIESQLQSQTSRIDQLMNAKLAR